MVMCDSHLSSLSLFFFFFNDTATTEIYTLSLHDALPILRKGKQTPLLRVALHGAPLSAPALNLTGKWSSNLASTLSLTRVSGAVLGDCFGVLMECGRVVWFPRTQESANIYPLRVDIWLLKRYKQSFRRTLQATRTLSQGGPPPL